MDSTNINTEHKDVTFGQQKEGFVTLFIPKLNNLVLWHHISNWADVMADIEFYGQNYEVFIGVHLGKEAKSGKQRTKCEDIQSIHCVAIDFDILDADAHKKIALPTSREEVLDFLKETPFHGKVHLNDSGYGIHGYIILDEPLLITDDKSRERAEALSKNTVNYIRSLAKELRGWEFDAVGDLPRLMRPLGSCNHKKGEKKPVEVLIRTDYRFGIEELEALVPAPEPTERKKTSATKSWQKAKELPDKKAQFEPIFNGCRFVRDGVENAETLAEPHWHALITITARCEDGGALSHEISQDHPNYSRSETTKKVGAAIASQTGPVTCRHIREELLHPACRMCPLTASKINSPIALGWVDGYLAGLFSRFVYDLQTKRFYEINPPMEALV
ncbi:MAG: hypothetical protein COB56_07945 [Robiginitomaculum sp.]|nr:MAG: hypothetical protein COB56_07945 [Robiginitomaculum sp.]